jgi:transcriptional regulator of arginine metabolism
MKTTRQRAILSLIATRPIHSQEELASLLEAQGYEVTQATVSRDVKELGLVKVPLRDGAAGATQQFKYVEPSVATNYTSRLHRVIAELVTRVTGAVNQVILRTPPGGAMMVASAVDAAEWPEIIGTIGGDDTVLVLLASTDDLPVVVQRFQDLSASVPSHPSMSSGDTSEAHPK